MCLFVTDVASNKKDDAENEVFFDKQSKEIYDTKSITITLGDLNGIVRRNNIVSRIVYY